jgi:hypothetical protein
MLDAPIVPPRRRGYVAAASRSGRGAFAQFEAAKAASANEQ